MRLLVPRPVRRLHEEESGQVTAYFIGLSLLLFAIMAISFDLGLLHLQRRTVQNSADPAAMAGAAYLERCALAGTGEDPLDVAENFAERNLGVGANFTASEDEIQTAVGSFHIENDVGEADWQTVRARVDREQSYIFGQALGLISATVPAEAEATCGPISEGDICPMWIEGDRDQEPVRDADGNVVSAYGLQIGKVYGMKINLDSEHYGALDPPNGSGKDAWRDFISQGCEDEGVDQETCEGCTQWNEPGDFGNPVLQALEGGAGADGLYNLEKTYGTSEPGPNLFPNAHLDCDLYLTVSATDSTDVIGVQNYVDGVPSGPVWDPNTEDGRASIVDALNDKSNPADMAADGAPCAGLKSDGTPVPGLVFESVQGRFMYIAMTDGSCTSNCPLDVLGILRMYIVCWTSQEDSADKEIKSRPPACVDDDNPAGTTIYGVFADFRAPNLLGGGGLGTNPLAPFHVVLVR